MKDLNKNRKGYKHTTLGWIPEEWEIKPLKELVDINVNTLNEKTDDNYTFYYIDLSSVEEGKIYFPTEKISSKNAPSRAKRLLKSNDILMSTVRPNLKGFALANFNTTDFVCSTGFAILSPHLLVDSLYIFQNLFSYNIWKQIENLVVGSNYPALNNNDVENLLIPYSLNSFERDNICRILSTWDATIETTANLIAAKEQLKKGLMQQLLTGKKRLPGFNGEWRKLRLGDIFLINAGGDIDNISFSIERNENYIYPVYSNSLTKNGLYGFSETYKYDNCITVTARGSIGSANFREHKFCAIGRVLILKPTCEMSQYFISEYINNFVNFYVESTGVPQLTAPRISNYGVMFPNSEEQFAISNILQKLDKEISFLKSQLELYRQQKKGLMQVLLTGAVRVKV